MKNNFNIDLHIDSQVIGLGQYKTKIPLTAINRQLVRAVAMMQALGIKINKIKLEIWES